MAKAIRWAAEDHQVDIRSMSFGFDEELLVDGQRLISNAISEALRVKNQRILFLRSLLRPTRAETSRRCFLPTTRTLHQYEGQTTRDGSNVSTLPRGFAGFDCFMTLGQDVPGAWLSKDGGTEVCKSGTPVSTPVAAE